jgi:Effector Associated Constant Component 1
MQLVQVHISLPGLADGMGPGAAERGAGPADLTRDLLAWLGEEPCLRGRVHVVERDPPPGVLGPVAVAVEAVLEPGGAVTALATVAVTWLRCRTGKVSLSVSGRNGGPDLGITAERAKGLDAAGVRDLIAQVSEV